MLGLCLETKKGLNNKGNNNAAYRNTTHHTKAPSDVLCTPLLERAHKRAASTTLIDARLLEYYILLAPGTYDNHYHIRLRPPPP